MAQIPGFEYDIFISYTHNDNHSSTDDPGWVDRFHSELESWLKYRRGCSDLVIWRDKELDGATVFSASIEEKIKKSALFFVLNSRNYPNSAYCRKELEWFYKYHGERPGGLIVGEHHRIFNILLCNIPFQDWPEELGETSGFAMHDAQSEAELGDFTSPGDDRFKKQLRAVVDTVEAITRDFSKLKPTPEVREVRDDEIKIFIADVADSLQDFKDRIIAEAAGAKVPVITHIPPPLESAQHTASVENALVQADLSIHLFDPLPGRKILDQTDGHLPPHAMGNRPDK